MKVNEKNFIKRLQKGKEDALEWTYDKYISLIKGIVSKVLLRFNDSGIIEECINDIFLSVWNNCDKFTGDENNFKNWICSIARFKAIDYYRNLIKKSEVILDCIDLQEKNTLEEEILITENKKDVMNLLDELESVDKEIFIMKYFLGLKAEEIGKRLNLSKSSIDSRIYRNKKKLKEKAIEFKLEVV
ncbi:DNA-directed RNA polymerase sigma-70 factor [Clostridium gelidum]|uniref:DNA-directed RNA polymerase sigma-70 factor n=1 Tax=Clostridium gelidum TaxID=704125 RepID=A0ABN6J020_9CLOT|nr:sigma-70 family RNA polymerase sigma factor [Clostridium gelidum]BCZ47715.1 DNA-directed RNA polymerase sigma-70 factor [Clostridium gelidum]